MMWFLFPWLSWWRAPVRVRTGKVEDAAEIAALHGRSFAHPWTPQTLEAMLAERSVFAHVADRAGIVGFILSRKAADEAEILSVAVVDSERRQGLGQQLVDANLDHLVLQRVRHVFLEVEAENLAALALYARIGFEPIGRRPGYYRQPDGTRRDAVTMRIDLARRRPPLGPLPDA